MLGLNFRCTVYTTHLSYRLHSSSSSNLSGAGRRYVWPIGEQRGKTSSRTHKLIATVSSSLRPLARFRGKSSTEPWTLLEFRSVNWKSFLTSKSCARKHLFKTSRALMTWVGWFIKASGKKAIAIRVILKSVLFCTLHYRSWGAIVLLNERLFVAVALRVITRTKMQIRLWWNKHESPQ